MGELVDDALAAAQAIVVLMTGDDEARLREQLRRASDDGYESEMTPQARANVLFEAGLALGRYPNQTILVTLGKVRPFSDISGRHIVRMTNDKWVRRDLAQRLIRAGCPANLDTEAWHTSGDFNQTEQ